MTVRELIEVLQAMDPERLVVLQKDAEGNCYSPIEGADDNAAYAAEPPWFGEVGKQVLTRKDRDAGFGKEDLAPKGATPCVILYPVN